MADLHQTLLSIVTSHDTGSRLIVERPTEEQWKQMLVAICFHNLDGPRADWRVPGLGPARKVLDLSDGQGIASSMFERHPINDEWALQLEPMNGGFSVRLQRRT